jgi:hypothetical protein
MASCLRSRMRAGFTRPGNAAWLEPARLIRWKRKTLSPSAEYYREIESISAHPYFQPEGHQLLLGGDWEAKTTVHDQLRPGIRPRGSRSGCDSEEPLRMASGAHEADMSYRRAKSRPAPNRPPVRSPFPGMVRRRRNTSTKWHRSSHKPARRRSLPKRSRSTLIKAFGYTR